jgi:hypothetical protein
VGVLTIETINPFIIQAVYHITWCVTSNPYNYLINREGEELMNVSSSVFLILRKGSIALWWWR